MFEREVRKLQEDARLLALRISAGLLTDRSGVAVPSALRPAAAVGSSGTGVHRFGVAHSTLASPLERGRFLPPDPAHFRRAASCGR